MLVLPGCDPTLNIGPKTVDIVCVPADLPFLRWGWPADLKCDGIVWVVWDRKAIAKDEFAVGFRSVVVEHLDESVGT